MEPKKDFDLDSRGNLLRSDKFLNTANNVLATVFNDKEIYTDPEDLVDAFYEKFRHVDSNTMDAMRLYNKIDELDEEERNDLRFVYETYRSLPTFWSDDTVNKGEAFLDYAMGILTDPFTAASVVGGSGLAAKTAASGLVMAGIKNATTAGLKTAALTGAGIDATTAVLGDKYIQESEKALKLRDEYSLGQAALAAGMSVVPGAIVGASLPALKAGYRKVRPSSTDLTKILREGKESYLNGNSAGQAYLNNEIVEGSFVQVPSTGKSIVQKEKFIKENLGYVEKINTANKTATINTGFDDAGNPIQITKQLDDIKLEDPFSDRVQKKIKDHVLKQSQVYNKAAAKEGFEQLNKKIIKKLGIKESDVQDFSFTLSSDSIDRLNDVYQDIIVESKMMYNPNKRITQNVGDAIRNNVNGFNHAKVAEILKHHHVSQVEFAAFLSGGYMGSISQAGTILGKQGRLAPKVLKEFMKDFNGGINTRFNQITKKIKPEEYYISLSDKAKRHLKERQGFTGLGLSEKEKYNVSGDKNFKLYLNDILKNKDIPRDAEQYYMHLLAERNATDKWLKTQQGGSINRIIRLGMISTPATTVRNVMGGVIRTPVDAVARTFDNLITMDLPMVAGGPIARPVKWTDGWDHMTAAFNPQEHKMITDFIASKRPDIQVQLFGGPEAFKEAMEITSKLSGDKTGIINKISSAPEKMFLKFNILNQLQDRYMKSQAFVTGLKHAMYRDNKKDLFDYIQRGDIEGIDSNHIKEGIEWALEYNYQTPGLEKYPIASLLQEVSTMPWGVGAALMPFPKFLFNAMRYMYQHSAIATPFTAFHVGKRNLKRAELGPLTSFEKQKYIRQVSQQLAGTGLLVAAFALRNSDYAGTKWNELMDYDGGLLDIATWFPLAPALYIAEAVKQYLAFDDTSEWWENVAESLGWEKPETHRGIIIDGKQIRSKYNLSNYSEEFLLNFGKAFGGPSTRSGIFKMLEPTFLASLISTEDEDESDIGWSLFGQYLGSVLSAVMQPAKLAGEVQKEFNISDEVRRYREFRNTEGFTANFINTILKDVPYFSETLYTKDPGMDIDERGRVTGFTRGDLSDDKKAIPYKYSVLNPEPLRLASPLQKQWTGTFKIRERNTVEEEFAKIGIPEFRIFRRTTIPAYDRVLKGLTASLVAGPLHNIITSEEYQSVKSLEAREFFLKTIFRDMKNKISSRFNEHHELGLLYKVNKVNPYIKAHVRDALLKGKLIKKNGQIKEKFSWKNGDFEKEELQALLEINKNHKKFVRDWAKKFLD